MDSKSLYLLVLIAILSVVTTALGGGLFSQQGPWQLQWQHQVFNNLCHQLPERSFWIGGQPMAVCSRCIGIYGGFALGWMLLPLSSCIDIVNRRHFTMAVVTVVIINLGDIVGNIIGFWQNSLVSRLAFGSVLGMAVALIFSGHFFRLIIKSVGNYYGRITVSDT